MLPKVMFLLLVAFSGVFWQATEHAATSDAKKVEFPAHVSAAEVLQQLRIGSTCPAAGHPTSIPSFVKHTAYPISSVEDCEKCLQNSKYVDYFGHRVIKTNSETFPILSSYLYDRDNGDGAMQLVANTFAVQDDVKGRIIPVC